MEINDKIFSIEAILFASGEPIELSKISQAVNLTDDITYKLINMLKEKYQDNSGIVLLELNKSFQFATNLLYQEDVKRALDIKKHIPLSNAAMEILAIIAYNQPVTKGFIEQIRGVESGQSVNNLVEKGLVEEAGRLNVLGRPIVYRTTDSFLRCFSLKSIEHLPPIPDDSGQVVMNDLIINTDFS